VDAVMAIALVLLLSAILSLALTPLLRTLARQRGWVDYPDGRRKLHAAPIPKIGGLAVFLSFVASLALMLFAVPEALGASAFVSEEYLHLVVAAGAVMLVGLADDLVGVRPLAKLAVQAAAAGDLCLHGFRIHALSNPIDGSTVSLGLWALPVTVLWFVGMSNAFNLIDGLDGLAAGLALFSTTTIFIAALINGRLEVALLATALGGALLGFLRYNFNPASIFLGDSGSLFVGFLLAAIAVRGSMKSSTAIAVAAPLLALAVPILDTGIAVARRLISGKRVFDADGDHIHHRLVRLGLTPRRVVVVLYAIAAAFGALSLLTMRESSQVIGIVVIASSVVTWIGIQQLGYYEFGEVGRVLTQGFSHERRAISNNVYLKDLTGQMAQAAGLNELWDILLQAADRLGFHGVALDLGPRYSRQLTVSTPARWHWRREETGVTEPLSTWTVPLVVEEESLGSLVLTRKLRKQPPFEDSYLLAALAEGFAPRLRQLVAGPEIPSAVDTRLVRRAATRVPQGG
jgi:UDP-GlcNAc:undecaprenyl-phosphate GlcNAc-1-phosphate transferase